MGNKLSIDSNIPKKKRLDLPLILASGLIFFGFLAIQKKYTLNPANIKMPISCKVATISWCWLMNRANKTAIKVCTKTTTEAPAAKLIASFLPSCKLILAAVMLIKPGRITAKKAIQKPKTSGKKLVIYLILKRIYVIALLISKYCF